MIAYQDDDALVWQGDCLDLLKGLDEASIDAIVTDPPYGINFMGKAWDGPGGMLGQIATGLEKATSGPLMRGGTHSQGYANHDATKFQAWVELWAIECLRVLKPGGHLLAFGGTRTYHRLTAGIEDAGFEIRDSIAWLYGSGFPKSLDVSKAIDRMAGVERERIPRVGGALNAGTANGWAGSSPDSPTALLAGTQQVNEPATPEAARWEGWGTALKPAFEPVVVARKPLTGTVAANVLAHGTGALNIDASRIGTGGQLSWSQPRGMGYHGGSDNGPVEVLTSTQGRWPANVVLDESQAAALDGQSGDRPPGRPQNRYTAGDKFGGTPYGDGLAQRTGWDTSPSYTDRGGASRFFYVAKAPAKERPKVEGSSLHPTVKPLTLMRWLVKLVTPPGGIVLDPFSGSGTTLEACLLEGFRCMAMEREADYLPLILHRIERTKARRDPDGLAG